MLPRVKNFYTRGTFMNAEQILTSIFKLADEKINSNIFREKYRIGKSFSRNRSLSFSNLMYLYYSTLFSHKKVFFSYFLLILLSSGCILAESLENFCCLIVKGSKSK